MRGVVQIRRIVGSEHPGELLILVWGAGVTKNDGFTLYEAFFNDANPPLIKSLTVHVSIWLREATYGNPVFAIEMEMVASIFS